MSGYVRRTGETPRHKSGQFTPNRTHNEVSDYSFLTHPTERRTALFVTYLHTAYSVDRCHRGRRERSSRTGSDPGVSHSFEDQTTDRVISTPFDTGSCKTTLGRTYCLLVSHDLTGWERSKGVGSVRDPTSKGIVGGPQSRPVKTEEGSRIADTHRYCRDGRYSTS